MTTAIKLHTIDFKEMPVTRMSRRAGSTSMTTRLSRETE
jgi:hypothetical protein